jgi:hypothetical protein
LADSRFRYNVTIVITKQKNAVELEGLEYNLEMEDEEWLKAHKM